jgi:hypothetical protein
VQKNAADLGLLQINNEEKPGVLEFTSFESTYLSSAILPIIKRTIILLGFSLVHIFQGRGLATIILPGVSLKKNEIITLWLFLGLIVDIAIITIIKMLRIPNKYFSIIIFGTTGFLLIIHLMKKPSKPKGNSFFVSWSQSDKIFIIIFFIIHIIGALQTHQSEAPLWIDGIFHNDILTRLVESKRISLNTAYPTGFHQIALANLLIWKITTPESTLLTGQWLIIISYLSFFLFSKSIYHAKSTPWLSTILLIFLSPFPSYLINWSRFPFAMGMAILPLVLFLTPYIFKSNKFILPMSLFMLLTGMTHYGIFIILTTGVLTKIIIFIKESQTKNARSPNLKILFPIIIIMLPVIIFLLYNVRETILNRSLNLIIKQTVSNANNVDFGYIFGLLIDKGGIVIIASSLIGVILNFKSSNKVNSFFLIWFVILIISMIAQLIVFGALISTAVDILYFSLIPCCILAGFAIERIIKRKVSPILEKIFIPKNNDSKQKSNFCLLIPIIVLILFVNPKLTYLTPRAILVTQQDLLAFEWIKNNIQNESVFSIDTNIWGEEVKPVDGGGWLTSFTGKTVKYPKKLVEKDSFWNFVIDNNINYFYNGSRSGQIQEDWFIGCPVVYQNKNVQIVYLTDSCLANTN